MKELSRNGELDARKIRRKAIHQLIAVAEITVKYFDILAAEKMLSWSFLYRLSLL